jgi:hypothetical protein
MAPRRQGTNSDDPKKATMVEAGIGGGDPQKTEHDIMKGCFPISSLSLSLSLSLSSIHETPHKFFLQFNAFS